MSANRYPATPAGLQRRLGRELLNRRDAVRFLAALGVAGVSLPVARQVAAQQATPVVPPMATPALGLRPNGTRVWRVQVSGGSEPDLLEYMTFFPREITINAGDTIFFDFKSLFSPHTVTFLSGQEAPPLLVPVDSAATPAAAGGEPPAVMFNPAAVFPSQGDTYDGTGIANAGLDRLRPPDQPYTLTFTKPGTFDYLCLVHPKMMKGKVTVQEKGAAIAHEQADVDATAAKEMGQLLERGKALIAKYDVAATPTAGGTKGNVWDVRAGAEDDEVAAARFFPGNLTIKAGDTVRWTDKSEFEPHTVTFVGGGEPPDLIEPEPQPGGPPKLVFNPDIVGRRGPQVYNGKGYANSGAMGADFKEFTGLTTYELTFDTPGQYPYYCSLHGSPTMGMRAKITVT